MVEPSENVFEIFFGGFEIIGIRRKGVGAAGGEQVKSMHIHSSNIHSWKKKIFTVAIFTV